MVVGGGAGITSHTSLLMVLQQDAPSLAWSWGSQRIPGSSQCLLAKAETTSQIYLRHIYKCFFIKSAVLTKNFVGNSYCDPE